MLKLRMKKPPGSSGGNVRMSELQQPKREEYRRLAPRRQAPSRRAPPARPNPPSTQRLGRQRLAATAASLAERGDGGRGACDHAAHVADRTVAEERALEEARKDRSGEAMARRRERLWDTVVGGQRAVLPGEAPESLWETGHDEERLAAFERLVPGALERATTVLRVLGAAAPEWHVNLPLDRLLEPWLLEAFSGELVAAALDRVLAEPGGMEGAARWLVHARGAGHVPSHDALRLVPEVARWALFHPVARNRTETLEVLADVRSGFVVPLLHELLAVGFEPRPLEPKWHGLVALFGTPETFFAFDTNLQRGTSDRAYAALLLARRGESGIRPRVRELMDTAGPADFHAFALALETLDRV